MKNDTLEQLRIDLYGENYDISTFAPAKMVGTELKWARIKAATIKAVIKKYKKDETLDLEAMPMRESEELTLVYFAISLSRIKEFDNQMKFLRKKIRYADTWMITDVLQQFIKKGPVEDFIPYYLEFSKSKYEYEKRFAYIYAMQYQHEKTDIFIDNIIYDDAYYIYMAQAWMLATFAIESFDKVYAFLQKKDAPISLKRKTISKMVDSFRITNEQKEIVKALREGFKN